MKVLLLAGGESSERDVSLSSGKAIYEALIRLGHKVLAVDPCTGQNLLENGNFILTNNARNDSLISSGNILLQNKILLMIIMILK